MANSLRDVVHQFILRSTLPLLVTASPGGPTVRGIVRGDDGHTRIALWAGDAGPGVAAEFALESLADNGEVLRAEAAVDHVRTVLTADFERHRSNPSLTRDSHHNAIVPVSPAEIAALAGRVGPEHGFARLFAMLAYGGDPPWFAEVFTFTGFMLQPGQRCRAYLRAAEDGTTYGIDFPLRHANGHAIRGTAASLPQELESLIRVGDLTIQPRIDVPDDYCDVLVDMTQWVDPPSPAG
ncbi:hypothetical protein AB0F73_11750 [Micromonospora purpureochromogenes]|uniref:hypothetical protein n=1 Tax=Micromonospora purpureochromogenes TaxID=47872 RepID=UPI0033E6A5A8